MSIQKRIADLEAAQAAVVATQDEPPKRIYYNADAVKAVGIDAMGQRQDVIKKYKRHEPITAEELRMATATEEKIVADWGDFGPHNWLMCYWPFVQSEQEVYQICDAYRARTSQQNGAAGGGQ
jgi:hypothetical protein